MSERPAKRPRITANMVTIARLVPMPVMAWLLFGGRSQLWAALVLGFFIASTDFVDGYLARKQGPTVLGGLLDPIADKVAVALTYLPLTMRGLFPAWAIALLFMREFVVTALRSAYQQRGLAMKTSYLAKVKTWVQMQGVGLLLFFTLAPRKITLAILAAATVGPAIAFAFVYLKSRRVWRSALVMTGFMLVVIALYALPANISTTINLSIYIIVALTWASGLDYMVGGLPRLRRSGDFGRADVVRVLGAVALPVVAVAALMHAPAPLWFWPIGGIISLELAAGGLDNLLSHHRAAAGAIAWSTRTLGVAALLAAALITHSVATAHALICAALAASLIGTVREFWRGRDFYLDARLRDEPTAGSPHP